MVDFFSMTSMNAVLTEGMSSMEWKFGGYFRVGTIVQAPKGFGNGKYTLKHK
jgi:hypothetical protein